MGPAQIHNGETVGETSLPPRPQFAMGNLCPPQISSSDFHIVKAHLALCGPQSTHMRAMSHESDVVAKSYRTRKRKLEEAVVELHACVALGNHPNITQIIDAGFFNNEPGLVFEQAIEDIALFILRCKGGQCPSTTRQIVTDVSLA